MRRGERRVETQEKGNDEPLRAQRCFVELLDSFGLHVREEHVLFEAVLEEWKGEREGQRRDLTRVRVRLFRFVH